MAQDYLVGASPRGWEDVSNVLKSGLPDELMRLFVQGRIGSANAAEFFGVLQEIQSGADVTALLAASAGEATRELLPASLDGLYGLVYGLVAMSRDRQSLHRAFEIIEQFTDMPGSLPVRESQTLTMELMLGSAMRQGLDADVLDSDAFQRYSQSRDAGARG